MNRAALQVGSTDYKNFYTKKDVAAARLKDFATLEGLVDVSCSKLEAFLNREKEFAKDQVLISVGQCLSATSALAKKAHALAEVEGLKIDTPNPFDEKLVLQQLNDNNDAVKIVKQAWSPLINVKTVLDEFIEAISNDAGMAAKMKEICEKGMQVGSTILKLDHIEELAGTARDKVCELTVLRALAKPTTASKGRPELVREALDLVKKLNGSTPPQLALLTAAVLPQKPIEAQPPQ